MAFSSATWDETKPAGSRSRSLGDDDIREGKTQTRERLSVDHDTRADETGAEETTTPTGTIGYHKKVTLTKRAADPTNVTDAGIVYTKDVSTTPELCFEDEDGTVTQLTSKGNNLANNTYLKATDAAGTGSVDLIKASASDVPVLPDASELATDAAPTTDVQIANKKYVDDAITAAVIALGSWSDKSSSYGAQVAASDGFVVATVTEGTTGGTSGSSYLQGYTDANANPTTLRTGAGVFNRNTEEFVRISSLCMPVKSGDYWKIVLTSAGTSSPTVTVYFISLS